MNKSARMQLTLSKPSSKELTKMKEKLRSQDQRLRQYESMCETEEGKHSHSIIPFHKKPSKRDLKNSPARLTRSKSKTLDPTHKKHSQEKSHQQKPQKGVLSNLYGELMVVKSEYNTLKQSYNKLMVEKKELTSRQQTEKEAIHSELETRGREVEKWQRMAQGYEQQIERVKRECLKLLQNERLKLKKLEQTIQEKDLMIAFLRSEIDKTKRGAQTTVSSINQSSLIFLQNNPFPFHSDTKPTGLCSNVIVEEISQPCRARGEEDSLSFSRDKSKEMDSIHSFLTAQDQSIHIATRKDIVIVESHSSFAEKQALSDSDQCLTFEHRGEEDCEDGLRNSLKPLKPLPSEKTKKNTLNLPPKNLSKIKCPEPFKKERVQTDENSHTDSNKNELVDSKKLMNSSLSSRKKTSSKKKKQ